MTLNRHLTIRFRATVLIQLHLRLPASTESESERTVHDGSTAGGSRFNQKQGEDPSALGPVQAACSSQEIFKPTPSASKLTVPHPLGPLRTQNFVSCGAADSQSPFGLPTVPCRPPSSVQNGHRHNFQGHPRIWRSHASLVRPLVNAAATDRLGHQCCKDIENVNKLGVITPPFQTPPTSSCNMRTH